MSDLISKSELYEKVCTWEAQALHMCEVTMNDEDITEWRRWSAILGERSAFKFDVADAPTIDAVEVVRCKDCIWYEIAQLKKDGTEDRRYKPSYCSFWDKYFEPDWFCAEGEMREEDASSR